MQPNIYLRFVVTCNEISDVSRSRLRQRDRLIQPSISGRGARISSGLRTLRLGTSAQVTVVRVCIRRQDFIGRRRPNQEILPCLGSTHRQSSGTIEMAGSRFHPFYLPLSTQRLAQAIRFEIFVSDFVRRRIKTPHYRHVGPMSLHGTGEVCEGFFWRAWMAFARGARCPLDDAGRMMRRTLANMASFYTEQQSVDVREGLARRVQGRLVRRPGSLWLSQRPQGRSGHG